MVRREGDFLPSTVEVASPTKRNPVGAGLAVIGGAVLGLCWAFVCPWLIGLDAGAAGPLRLELIAFGLGSGLCAVAATPRGVLGSSGAARVGLMLSFAGILAAILGALSSARSIGAAPAMALGLCCLGAAVALGLLVTALGFAVDRKRNRAPSEARGVPLRALIAGACGGLAIAAWALASGHVLGQRHTDASRHAIDEARDLVSIAAERHLVKPGLDALASALSPPGGYLVTVDDEGLVLNGVGANVSPGTLIRIAGDRTTVCRISHQALPCAVRRLGDNARVVAAVASEPISGDVVLAFALVGLAVAGAALAIGGLVGSSTARHLERVSSTVDDLRRSAKGLIKMMELDRPIVVASLDEVGDLAAALGRLRARLGPTLAEHRAALEKSQAADRARDDFLALVSVELRSPLDLVISAAEGLLDPHSEPMTPEQRDDVQTVLSASKHLTELIDEVLDVSAIATGQVALRLGKVDLGTLVANVAKSQRPIVQKKGVDVIMHIDSPSPEVRGDERRLRQVVTNIISNAVKFTERGSIECSVKKTGGRVEVIVKDTGPGIPPDALPKLFREFVQLGSLKQRAHGTGLGLAICKRLVEAHDGEVGVESEPGRGATFTISLPMSGPLPTSHVGDDTPVQAV